MKSGDQLPPLTPPPLTWQVGTRTAQQCRERYENVLNPDINIGPFTAEEVALLEAACGQQMAAHGRIVWSQVRGDWW